MSVQLIDCATAMHVWGDRFAAHAADLETVRGEISVRLAYTVRLAVIDASADPCVSLRWNGVDARLLTARGWATFHKTNSRSVAQESLRYFQQALLLEPDSVYATQGALTVALRDVAEEWSRLDDDIDERLLAVYDRDVNQSLTHQLIGLTRRIQGRLDESLVEFDIARDLDRTSVSAIRLQAYAMIFAGQVDGAIWNIEKVIRLSPNDAFAPGAYAMLGFSYLLTKDYNRSIEMCLKSLSRNRQPFYTHLQLAATLGLQDKREAASAALAEAIRLKPDVRTVADLLSRHNLSAAFSAELGETYIAGLHRAGMPAE